VIAKLVGVALDARAAASSKDPRERALAARWIAANLLAVRGVRVDVRGEGPSEPRIFGVHARTLTGAIAAVAAVPSLLDPATLPLRWYVALRALGVPVADRPLSELVAAGASVAQLEPVWRASAVSVDPELRVDVARDHLLVA
jgi:hypothetical protein